MKTILMSPVMKLGKIWMISVIRENSNLMEKQTKMMEMNLKRKIMIVLQMIRQIKMTQSRIQRRNARRIILKNKIT